jgi:hypothetical protein
MVVLSGVASLLIGLVANAGAQPFCTLTAEAALNACELEIRGDRWIAEGKCRNIADDDKRTSCIVEAHQAFEEGKEECEEQFEAREDLCELLGGGRYDPDFSPARFVDPRLIGRTVPPNPYFPLVRGNRWVYRDGDETVTVTVTEKVKVIEGVTCVVVTDVVMVGGVAVEVTDDWFAQDLAGNVFYCGEVSREFEAFAGDVPAEAELVALEGSWKAGRDFDQPGIIMLGSPKVGDVYREEMSLGNAEDAAEILSVSGTESVPAASCGGKCVVTRNFSPLSPDGEETKYYAPGVGLILETHTEEGNRVELVEFSPGTGR